MIVAEGRQPLYWRRGHKKRRMLMKDAPGAGAAVVARRGATAFQCGTEKWY